MRLKSRSEKELPLIAISHSTSSASRSGALCHFRVVSDRSAVTLAQLRSLPVMRFPIVGHRVYAVSPSRLIYSTSSRIAAFYPLLSPSPSSCRSFFDISRCCSFRPLVRLCQSHSTLNFPELTLLGNPSNCDIDDFTRASYPSSFCHFYCYPLIPFYLDTPFGVPSTSSVQVSIDQGRLTSSLGLWGLARTFGVVLSVSSTGMPNLLYKL